MFSFLKGNLWVGHDILSVMTIAAIICDQQDAGMWQDALRVCKEYIPHKLSALQDEYEREMMDKSTRGAETLIQQVMFCFGKTKSPVYGLKGSI